jgi:hypothetical protein
MHRHLKLVATNEVNEELVEELKCCDLVLIVHHHLVEDRAWYHGVVDQWLWQWL